MLIKLVDASTDLRYNSVKILMEVIEMKYKRYIFPVLMGATMSNIMSLVNTGKIVFPAIIVMMLLQATVASVASLIYPAGMVGANLTEKFFPKIHYIMFLIISSIIPAIYFTAIMSISGLLKMKGYSNDFWNTYFSSLPIYILYGYVVSFIWNILLDKILKSGRHEIEE